MKLKVALGLSGGVDSAVSAYLLKKQGFDVSCMYLNCFDSDIPGCRGDNDRKDALAVTMHLGLPFRVLDFRKEYQAAVIDYFKKEYLAGRTPNPDVICNRDIKFGLFLDWAIKAGFDYVATGHYAKILRKDKQTNGLTDKQINRQMDKQTSRLTDNQIVNSSDHPIVRLSVSLGIPTDLHKDQTYFLWAVPAEKFKRVLFPLGGLLKTEVRKIALKIGLPVARKKDSTGICFIGEVRVEDFLKKLGVKEKKGEVVVREKMVKMAGMVKDGKDGSNLNNLSPLNHYCYRVIGSHRGVWFYTIGQRHGFEITNWPFCHPERSEAESRDLAAGDKNIASLDSSTSSLRSVARNDGVTDRPPFYVIEKDIKKNRLIVGFGADCYRDNFEVGGLNWLAPEVASSLPWSTSTRRKSATSGLRRPPFGGLLVRLRHGGELIPCSVIGSQFSAISPKSIGYPPTGAPARLAARSVAGRWSASDWRAGQSVGLKPTNRKPANQNLKTENGEPITVFLSIPQRGIAPGQSAVFYLKDGLVLGGGVIQNSYFVNKPILEQPFIDIFVHPGVCP